MSQLALHVGRGQLVDETYGLSERTCLTFLRFLSSVSVRSCVGFALFFQHRPGFSVSSLTSVSPRFCRSSAGLVWRSRVSRPPCEITTSGASR